MGWLEDNIVSIAIVIVVSFFISAGIILWDKEGRARFMIKCIVNGYSSEMCANYWETNSKKAHLRDTIMINPEGA